MGYFSKTYHPPGTSPGTLVAHRAREAPVDLHLIDYSKGCFEEITLKKLSDCIPYLQDDATTWIHVRGQVQPELLAEMGNVFGLHSLALEDVLNSGQRPKMDDYEQHIFLALAVPQGRVSQLDFKQLSLFLGPNYLISFYAGDDELLNPIRKRLRGQSDRLLTQQADYLLYTVLDLVIDLSFPLLEQFGDLIEDIEDKLLRSPSQNTLHQIHQIRRELLQLRRVIWPLREVINRLLHDNSKLIQPSSQLYLRDCYDHNIQIIDLLENYREMATSLIDVYLSSVNTRLSETMRVLTLIATLFMPLTFVAGIYGMNFENSASPWAMPELKWYYGYPMALGIMICVALGMLLFFKRKGWLKRADRL